MTKYEDRLTKVRDSELEYMYERDRNNYSLEKEMHHRGLSTEEEEEEEDYYYDDDDEGVDYYKLIKFIAGISAIGAILYGLTLGLASLHYIIDNSSNYQTEILFALAATFILVSIARGCSRFFNWLFYFSLMGTVTLLYRQLIISEEGSYAELMNRFDLGDVLGYSAVYLVLLVLTFVFGSLFTRIWGYLIALYFPKSYKQEEEL